MDWCLKSVLAKQEADLADSQLAQCCLSKSLAIDILMWTVPNLAAQAIMAASSHFLSRVMIISMGKVNATLPRALVAFKTINDTKEPGWQCEQLAAVQRRICMMESRPKTVLDIYDRSRTISSASLPMQIACILIYEWRDSHWHCLPREVNKQESALVTCVLTAIFTCTCRYFRKVYQ